MAKLVLLSEGRTGQSYELKGEKTTVGRVDDNNFHLEEASVSSHHCEITLRSNEAGIKDLNSTNGTYINGEKITEGILKPGQILRLGSIEMRLEIEGVPNAPAPAPAPAAAPAPPAKKHLDQTKAMQGVKFDPAAAGGKPVFEKNSPFAKKSNKTNVIFITIGVVLGLVILGFVVMALKSL